MSVAIFAITNMKVALNHSTEKNKRGRCGGYFSSSRYGKKIQAGICLFLVEVCERFTFFEVVCNMIPFCTVKLGYHNYQAAILNLCFIGTSILTPVFVGWLADVYLGRSKVLYICLFLHFLGSALLSAAAFPLEDVYRGAYRVPTRERIGLFLAALLTISLGVGGIRAHVCPLGAYGLREQGAQKPASFFNWFFWLTNFNAMVVFLGISYIQHSGAWTLVVLIPFTSTLMVLVTLLMMCYNLIYQPGKCRSHVTAFRVFVGALKRHCLPCYRLGGEVTRWVDQAQELNGSCYGDRHVEDTKFLLALLPLFVFQVLYRMCAMQIPSGYYVQTMHSSLRLDGLLLPVAVMNIISILPFPALAPLMEYFNSRLPPAKREGPLPSARIIAGHLAAALSVTVAGFSEIRRKRFPPTEQPLGGKVLTVSSMPCVHLVLQYVLLGVAETLVNPALSVTAYRSVPSTVRGASMNLLTLFNGFGCFTGALLVALAYLISEGNWFPNTLNKGNLESFFFLLASLTLLNVLGFWSVSPRYCNLNHFNAQNISGSNLEETLLLQEKSLKFYGSIQEISSSIDLWETAL